MVAAFGFRETTVVVLKPDAVRRGLIGQIVARLEQRQMSIKELRLVHPTKATINSHYPTSEAWIQRLGEKTVTAYAQANLDATIQFKTKNPKVIGKKVRTWLVNYMVSGPIVVIAVEGLHAISMVRKVIGQTMPFDAEVGTIRGDFSTDSGLAANSEERVVANLVHSSETKEEAEHEYALWFKA